MEHSKREAVNAYFNKKVLDRKALARTLADDGRVDEADFAKIELNIFELFHTVFSAALKASGDDDRAVGDFFLAKLEEIPRNWREAFEKAQSYGNVEKAHVESIKLAAAGDIRTAFLNIWEVPV